MRVICLIFRKKIHARSIYHLAEIVEFHDIICSWERVIVINVNRHGSSEFCHQKSIEEHHPSLFPAVSLNKHSGQFHCPVVSRPLCNAVGYYTSRTAPPKTQFKFNSAVCKKLYPKFSNEGHVPYFGLLGSND
jgi:hypothetical protein